MDCANQLRSSRTEYDSDTNPNICQFVAIRGIRGLCGIGVFDNIFGSFELRHYYVLSCFSSYVGLDPTSTVYPQNISGISARPQNIFVILGYPK